MSRPKKWRNVCHLPGNRQYGPLDEVPEESEVISMTVEEYETIRLIDYTGMIQEDCAENMEVARTTVQHIYSNARKKIAESLVRGIPLVIEGGRYKVCEHSEDCQRRKTCCRRKYRSENINGFVINEEES